MKLYAIVDASNDRLIAMSEDKADVIDYFNLKNFPEDDFNIIKIKKKKIVNRAMFDYEDFYIEFDDDLGIPLTRFELSVLRDIVDEEKERIRSTISDLKHVLKHYDNSKYKRDVLGDAIEVLEGTKKKKSIRKSLVLESFDIFIKFDNFLLSGLKEKKDKFKDTMKRNDC